MEAIKERHQGIMRQLEAAGVEAELQGSIPVEEYDEETAGTTSPAHQVFQDAHYRLAKVLNDVGEPLLMANDKCQYHVVLVIHCMSIRFQCKSHVIHHITPQNLH